MIFQILRHKDNKILLVYVDIFIKNNESLPL